MKTYQGTVKAVPLSVWQHQASAPCSDSRLPGWLNDLPVCKLSVNKQIPAMDIADTGKHGKCVDAQARSHLKRWHKTFLSLLTQPNQNLKLSKSSRPTYGLSLAPSATSGCGDLCPMAGNCSHVCLATAGNGRYNGVTVARIAKTRCFAEHPELFIWAVGRELLKHKKKQNIACRLNVISDLNWTRKTRWLFEDALPDIQFYDYTKVAKYLYQDRPKNYHITLSRQEGRDDECIKALEDGHNVAVVFDTKPSQTLPSTWHGFPVIDGDLNDERWRDAPGHVVGLRAKGSARGDQSGFVVSSATHS
ncbi:MAG: hypothetical protein GOVbin1630_29 [Prokaryotic dsDNA virus sp.]|nr:MAG: hypothetical protein GOVbin1630_29 [Prokaryotic dsDNA virus sp.]